MKITKEKSEKNRQTLLESAALLFSERGIDGTGVADVCKKAGLTQGALYSHFNSKEDLAAEALAYKIGRSSSKMKKITGGKERALKAYLDSYLSAGHRDNISDGCPMAASSSEIGRHGSSLSSSFTDGFLEMVKDIESFLDPGLNPAGKKEKHRRALMIVSAMIGAIAIARAIAKSDPALSDEVLRTIRELLTKLDESM